MPLETGQPRLLFVEDEEGIRLTLGTLLTKNGFEVTSGRDGQRCADAHQLLTL